MKTVANSLMGMREEITEEREGVSIAAGYVSEEAWRSHRDCPSSSGTVKERRHGP